MQSIVLIEFIGSMTTLWHCILPSSYFSLLVKFISQVRSSKKYGSCTSRKKSVFASLFDLSFSTFSLCFLFFVLSSR